MVLHDAEYVGADIVEPTDGTGIYTLVMAIRSRDGTLTLALHTTRPSCLGDLLKLLREPDRAG